MIIARALAAAAVATGVAAWIAYLRADLVLSHYDARAHLVVARRIFDSITPGWEQIGGVWLPLPHLLNAIPAQVDLFYRTGAFASLLSIACLGVTTYATARLVVLSTGSRGGAVVSASLLVLNPNLLYLHTTPMTEPLLLAAIFLVVLFLYEWVPLGDDTVQPRLAAALFAAAWTRYEAWPVLAAAIGAALYASERLGLRRDRLIRRAWRLAVWPAAAVTLFLLISRVTTGAWLVTGGFYEIDPGYAGRLGRDVLAVWWGTHQLSTRATELVAVVTAALLAFRALQRPADAGLLVPVALFACAALPVYAFYEGHPFRIRYMLSLTAVCALFAGMAVGFLRRQAAAVLGGFLIGITLVQSPPWRRDAPMLAESQWDDPFREGRRRVTDCLMREYRGEKILASMGSLAHYMQELSQYGLAIADFIHEGNGDVWERALESGPSPDVRWMLVEEQSEGGDAVAQRMRDPEFARGMERVCDGGGVALYERR